MTRGIAPTTIAAIEREMEALRPVRTERRRDVLTDLAWQLLHRRWTAIPRDVAVRLAAIAILLSDEVLL